MEETLVEVQCSFFVLHFRASSLRGVCSRSLHARYLFISNDGQRGG